MGHKSTWISVAGHVKRNRWSEKDVILNMTFIDELFLFYSKATNHIPQLLFSSPLLFLFSRHSILAFPHFPIPYH